MYQCEFRLGRIKAFGRLRAQRQYTSINVIASVVFDNGSSKRIYEPLPVMHP